MSAYLECLANPCVVYKFSFLFSLHVDDWCEVFLTEWLLAVFVVLSNTGVLPALILDGTCVFVPSKVVIACGLANVYGLVRASTCVLVDALFAVGVRLCLVAAAEQVLKFGCRCECGVDVAFFEDASQLGANFRYVGDANI